MTETLNAAQPRYPERQSWDPARYRRNAAYVADLAVAVVDLLAPKAGEAILDLGCGDGRLTERIAAADADVTAIDSSAAQVRAAQGRGVAAQVCDAREMTFERAFDAVFSNAALHWMPEADVVAAAIARALRPGGRFVGEMGGEGNVARVHEALATALSARGIDPEPLYPWYFPTAGAYAEVLGRHGFHIDSMDLIPRWTPLETPLADWLETFTESFLKPFGADERDTVVAEVEATLAPDLRDDSGRWHIDYVRLRFHATLEPD